MADFTNVFTVWLGSFSVEVQGAIEGILPVVGGVLVVLIAWSLLMRMVGGD
jgi:hypothetical protein